MVLMTLVKAAVVVGLIVAAATGIWSPIVAGYRAEPQPQLFSLSIIVLCLGSPVDHPGRPCRWPGRLYRGSGRMSESGNTSSVGEVLPFRDSFNYGLFSSRLASDGPAGGVEPSLHRRRWGCVRRHCRKIAHRRRRDGLWRPLQVGGSCGVALARAEFSFILAQQGQDAGLFTGDRYRLFLAGVGPDDGRDRRS